MSASSGNLTIWREVFRANLEELTLVKMNRKVKIDSLFGKLEGAADAWGDLKKMKRVIAQVRGMEEMG